MLAPRATREIAVATEQQVLLVQQVRADRTVRRARLVQQDATE